MKRRQFLGRMLGISVALPSAIALFSACGSNSDSGGSSGEKPDGDCATGAPVDYINPGHSHRELTLSAADITAAIPGSYLLLDQGSNNHSHTFSLTAQNFTDLQNGMTVRLDNDNPNDGHIVELSC